MFDNGWSCPCSDTHADVSIVADRQLCNKKKEARMPLFFVTDSVCITYRPYPYSAEELRLCPNGSFCSGEVP